MTASSFATRGESPTMRVITLEEHFATPMFLDGPGQDLKTRR
jgi:hypothetical protein